MCDCVTAYFGFHFSEEKWNLKVSQIVVQRLGMQRVRKQIITIDEVRDVLFDSKFKTALGWAEPADEDVLKPRKAVQRLYAAQKKQARGVNKFVFAPE